MDPEGPMVTEVNGFLPTGPVLKCSQAGINQTHALQPAIQIPADANQLQLQGAVAMTSFRCKVQGTALLLIVSSFRWILRDP